MNNCLIITNRLVLKDFTLDNLKDLTRIAKSNAKIDTKFLIDELSKNFDKYKDLIEEYGLTKLMKYVENKKLKVKEEDLFAFMGSLQYPFKASSKELIERAITRQNEEPRCSYLLGVYLREDITKLIGYFVITSKVFETKSGTRTGYFGYMIDPKFQRKGYTTEIKMAVFDLFINKIFKSDPLFNENTVLFANAHPLNLKSDSIQKKFGAELGQINLNTKYGSRQDYFFKQDTLKKLINSNKNNKYVAILNNDVFVRGNDKVVEYKI